MLVAIVRRVEMMKDQKRLLKHKKRMGTRKRLSMGTTKTARIPKRKQQKMKMRMRYGVV